MSGFGLLIGAAPSAQASTFPHHDEPKYADDYVPFSLAISGGVSLGSYEAGVNWALLYYLKFRRRGYDQGKFPVYPELRSVSGASAGSINALISAINWCVDEDKLKQNSQVEKQVYHFSDNIDNNLFRDIWVKVGIEELLPDPNVNSNYDRHDGLLSRKAFDAAINNIKSALQQDIIIDNCSVSIRITVTRVEPLVMSVAGVKVENQRFMIPIRLQGIDKKKDKGGVKIFSHPINHNDPYLGNVMYLKGLRDVNNINRHEISIETLFDAVLTSSAFPIAFRRRQLQYCARDNDNMGTATERDCPLGYYLGKSEFLDEGVFDNVPLGIAKALAEPSRTDALSQQSWRASARRYNYIYIDPDNRRNPNSSRHKEKDGKYDEIENESLDKMSYGIRSQLKFLGGAVSSGRNYELYNVLRGGDWTRQTNTYACRLYATVHDLSNIQQDCQPPNYAIRNQCHKLSSRLDNNESLSSEQRRDAAVCMLKGAEKLEKIHNGEI